MTQALPCYVGYDSREDDAYRVCKFTLNTATAPVHVVKLDQGPLRKIGLYDRPFDVVDGQRIDERDGRPFSTDFSFSRFLVPALCLYQGWALFCDDDFMFTRDIAELFALGDPKFAAMCVKHNHDPVESYKMDGVVQSKYRRKNWSSLILWNCGHPSNAGITPQAVNYETGQWLHALSWLRDDEIGELPATWNWLCGVNDPLPNNEVPAGIHYTLGIPSWRGYENSAYADLWRNLAAGKSKTLTGVY